METHVTGVFTSLTAPGQSLEQTDVGISSLIDTWLLLRDFESGGERNRGIFVLKSRGMGHSNQVREFLLTDHGIELVDVCVGPHGVLIGSQRRAREAEEKLAAETQEEEAGRQQREIEVKRQVMEARIATLRSEFRLEEERIARLLDEEAGSRERQAVSRREMARSRQGDLAGGNREPLRPRRSRQETRKP